MSLDDDEAFSAFLDECFNAGPSSCPLTKGNATASSVYTTIFDRIDQLKQNPVALPMSLVKYDALIMGSTIDYSSMKNLLFTTLYHPWNFPLMAAGLEGLLTGNLTAMGVWRDEEIGIFGATTEAESIYGIRCADKHTRTDNPNDLLPFYDAAQRNSKIGTFPYTAVCAQWKLDAKERYTGDFKANTSFPMLIVGNTYDPATPIESARNISSGFAGSMILERTGFGVGVF
jgi:hypothetical protein